MLKTLGQRLRAARQDKGYTQEQVARAAGVHEKTVSRWENNHQPPKASELARVAEELEVTVEWLLSGEERMGWMLRDAPAETYTAQPALKRRLPPNAYAVVHARVRQMERAGVPQDQIEEAERLMVESNYSKLNARDPRERTEDELITDINAAWAAISTALRAAGFKV